jgi:hypothetical protein
MDDEQQYYKEKYFKYKLKYLTLKEQLGGVPQKAVKSDNKKAVKSDNKKAVIKESDDIAEKILKYLYELLDGMKKYNTDINRITKLMTKVLQKYPKRYDLTKLEDIKEMLRTVLKMPYDNGTIPDEKELYNYLIKQVRTLYFS